MRTAQSWSDVLSLLTEDLTPADHAGGWTDELQSKWLGILKAFGPRFLPSHAAQVLRLFQTDGVTSGPIVEALASAKHGIPGVATPQAVAVAVKEVSRGLRRFSLKGSSPHLQRELDDGTLNLVNLQKVVAGVTGREPGFTVNVNVVHGALRRAWQQTGHWQSTRPVRSGMDTGVATRLGEVAFGRDHWWHPSTEEEARAAAAEVIGLMESHGLPWLDRLSDPEAAIAWLLPQDGSFQLIEVAAALLVERPNDQRRAQAERALRRWSPRIGGEEKALLNWLMAQLAGPPDPGGRSSPSPPGS
ncbi:MAG: DUF4304 domain-containing protein [Actinobacteria bacterium]|nr:DUF4304 domain-containing protein [Actinomycetota bacterium]